MVTQQAAVMCYSNDFLLMTIISLVAFPFVMMMRQPKTAAAAEDAAASGVNAMTTARRSRPRPPAGTDARPAGRQTPHSTWNYTKNKSEIK